jgi:hypothetical protein
MNSKLKSSSRHFRFLSSINERLNHLPLVTSAILRGESTYEGVNLPSPQRTGTYTQQQAYANLQARNLLHLN